MFSLPSEDRDGMGELRWWACWWKGLAVGDGSAGTAAPVAACCGCCPAAGLLWTLKDWVCAEEVPPPPPPPLNEAAREAEQRGRGH